MLAKSKADLQLRKYLPFLEFLTAKDPARNKNYTQIASWIRQKEVRTEIEKEKCEKAIKYRYDLVKRGKEYVLPKNVIDIFEPVLLEISDDSDCEILDVTPGKPPDSNTDKSPSSSKTSSKDKAQKFDEKFDLFSLSGEESSSNSIEDDKTEKLIRKIVEAFSSSDEDQTFKKSPNNCTNKSRNNIVSANTANTECKKTCENIEIASERLNSNELNLNYSENIKKFGNDNSKKESVTKFRTKSAVESVNRIAEVTNETRTNLIVEQSISSRLRKFDENCQNTVNCLKNQKNDSLLSETNDDVVNQSVERRPSIESPSSNKPSEVLQNKRKNREPVESAQSTDKSLVLGNKNFNNKNVQETKNLAFVKGRESNKHKSKHEHLKKNSHSSDFGGMRNDPRKNKDCETQLHATSKDSEDTKQDTTRNNKTNKEFLFSRREKKPNEAQANNEEVQLFTRRNKDSPNEKQRRSTERRKSENASIPKTTAKPYDRQIETVSLLSDDELETPKTSTSGEQNCQVNIPKESRLPTSSSSLTLPSKMKPVEENRTLQTNTKIVSQNLEISTNSLNTEIENLELDQLKNNLVSEFCEKNGVPEEELEKMITQFLHSEADVESNNFSKQNNFSNQTFSSSSEINLNSLHGYQQQHQHFQQQSQHVFHENPQSNHQFHQHQHIHQIPNNPPQPAHPSNQKLLHALIKRNDPRIEKILKTFENSPIAPSDLRNFAANTRQINNDPRVSQVPEATPPSRTIGPEKCPKTYKEYRLQKEKAKAEKLAAELKKIEAERLRLTIGKDETKVKTKTKHGSQESEKSSSPLDGKVKLSGICRLVSSSSDDDDFDQPESVLERRKKKRKIFVPASSSSENENEKKIIESKSRTKKRKIFVPASSSSENENEKKIIESKSRTKKRKIFVPASSSSENENEKKIIESKSRTKKRKIFVPASSSSENENHEISSQNISKPGSILDYLPTKEIEKALDTVMPAIEEIIVTSPLTVETGHSNTCSTGSLSPTGKAFSRCARELSKLQCTLNGAPNVLSMLTSSRRNKRRSSCVAGQKIGSQLASETENEQNLSCDFVSTKTTAAPIARRRRTLVEHNKTKAKSLSRRRMTCDERFQLRINHDDDDDLGVRQMSLAHNEIHQVCMRKTSEEGRSSSDTDQFDYEEYKLQKAKAKAMASKISIVIERLPESVVEEITKRNEKELVKDIRAPSKNRLTTFAKKSTSFVRNSTNAPRSKISKNTLNTNRDMIYDSTPYCVLCKSKPRSDLTEHYVHRHQTESYVSRLSEEKLDEISSSMQIAELVPTASESAGNPKYKVTCGFCNDEIVDTFINFYAHYSTHTGEYAFRCDSCDLLKPFREDIISHQRHKRGCRRAKVCSQYSYRSDVTVIRLYACGFCNFVQLNEANTEKHIRDHHRHHYSLANNETNIRGVILAAIVDSQLANERVDLDEQEEERAYHSPFSGEQMIQNDDQALDIKDMEPMSNDKINVEKESSLETGEAETTDTTVPPIPMTIIHNTVLARVHESVFPPGEQHSPMPDPTDKLTVKTEILEASSSASATIVPSTVEDRSASSTSNFSKPTETNNGTSPYIALTKYRDYSMPKPYFGLFKCMAIDCVFSTDDKDQMLQHLSDHRASERPPQGYLECSYCRFSQNEHSTPSALIEHIQDSHALSRYQCSQCCYRSCLPGNVQIHRKLCHRDDVEDSNCSTSDNIVYLCAGRETTINEKIDHMRCEMSKNVKPLSCLEIACPTKLYAISSIEEHLTNFHKFKSNVIAVLAKFNSWTCIYCGENVHTKQKIQEHLAINHPDEFAFACHRVLINNSGKIDEDNSIENLHLVDVSTIVMPKNIRTAEGEEEILSNSMNKTTPIGKNIPASIGSLNASKSIEIESSSLSQSSLVRSASVDEDSQKFIANSDSEQVNCVTPTEIKRETEEDYIKREKADLRPLILKLTSGTGIAPDFLYRCPVKECSAFFSIFELWSKHVSLKHSLFMVDCPHYQHCKTELPLQEFSNHFQSHCRHLFICFECGTTSVSETECVIHYFESHENGVDLMNEKVNVGGNYSYIIIRRKCEMSHLDMLRQLSNTIRLKLQNVEAQEAAKEMIRWPHQHQEWEDDYPSFVDFHKQGINCICHECLFTADDDEILFRHLVAEHSVLGQSYTCSKCEFVLSMCTDWDPVIDHLRKHLSDLFVCCTCGFHTSSRDLMTTHIKSSHNSRDVIVINYFRSMEVQRFISIDIVLAEKITTPTLRDCFCCEKIINEDKLTSHLNYEHNLRFRYFCEYCGEKLESPLNIADHHAAIHLNMDCRSFKLRCALATTSKELRVTKVIPFTLDVPTTRKHPLANDDERYGLAGKKIKLDNDVIIDDEIIEIEEAVQDVPVETPKITLKCANISNLLDSNALQTSAAETLPSCTYSNDEIFSVPQERTTVSYLPIASQRAQQNIQTPQPLLRYTPAGTQGREQGNHVSQPLLPYPQVVAQTNFIPWQLPSNAPNRVQGEFVDNRTPEASSYTPSRFPEAQLAKNISQPLLPTPTGAVQGAHQFNSYPQPQPIFSYAPIEANHVNQTVQPFHSYGERQTQCLYPTWTPPTTAPGTAPYVPMVQYGAAPGMHTPAPSTINSYPINPPAPPVTTTFPNINSCNTFVPPTINPSSRQPSSNFPSHSQCYYAPQNQSAMLNTTTSQYQQSQLYW